MNLSLSRFAGDLSNSVVSAIYGSGNNWEQPGEWPTCIDSEYFYKNKEFYNTTLVFRNRNIVKCTGPGRKNHISLPRPKILFESIFT